MARTKTTTALENRAEQRTFASPVALAFVHIVVARRKVTEAEARKIYLDYLNRTQPHRRGEHPAA